ncbi:hypothetical protein WN55_05120 [Dufourea novaeangliae]|uniref:Uncharacterized protein n=1 Tax=Dufourea novaeangliae TaxID=178035 RepID=A0A154PQM7_DUFNO|nr:hypothetical protein WN55_05120 [Dufourea novaeangliae]
MVGRRLSENSNHRRRRGARWIHDGTLDLAKGDSGINDPIELEERSSVAW